MERLAEADVRAKKDFDHSLAISIIETLNPADSSQLLDDTKLVLSELQFYDGDEAQVFINLVSNGTVPSLRVNKAFELLAQMAEIENLASFEQEFRQAKLETPTARHEEATKRTQVVKNVGAVATSQATDDLEQYLNDPIGSWQVQAACAQEDPELFFAEEPKYIEMAKAICITCPVRIDCLEHAVKVKDYNGIWGGLTGGDRQALRQKPINRQKYS